MEANQSFSIQDIAIKQLETTKKVYLLSPDRMFSEFNGEKENVKNYNGRQLLEMLQNADDAAQDAETEKKVLIRLKENRLTIANTGAPFSEEGLRSIFHSHLSPKAAKKRQIGKKGLGFRSILSWASKVTIKSHGLCVAFSPLYSKKMLDELLENPDFFKEYIKLKGKNTIPISTLVCPEVKDVKIEPFEGIDSYDTIIQIDLKEKAIPEVLNQVKQDIDGEVLLFLNNLDSIQIDLNGSQINFSKEFIDENIQITSFIEDKIEQKVWNIYSFEGRFDDLEREYQLSIAWRDNFEDSKDIFYSYFRTKVPIKANGIVHGSFELNADRNLIIEDGEGYNKRLAMLLPDLFAGASEAIADQEIKQVNYKPIIFLNLDITAISHIVDKYTFKNKLIKSIKTKKVFPTISNQFIAWNDNDAPVYYKEEEFAEFLDPDEFPDLLLCCDTEDQELFIESLDPTTYKLEGIIKDIASKKNELSISAYARLIVATHAQIADNTEIKEYRLLYDQACELLISSQPIFLPKKGKPYKLPPEIGIQILNTDLAGELVEHLSCGNLENLIIKLKYFNLKLYNFHEVVTALVKHYRQSEIKKNTVLELHQFLFNFYSMEKDPGEKWMGYSVPLLTKANTLRPAVDLYFGSNYGYSLTETIYSYNKSKIIASAKVHGIGEDKILEWKIYLEWLGVSKSPRVIKVESEHEYIDYIMRNYDYRQKIEDYSSITNYTKFINELSYHGSNEVFSIDDIDNIIKHNTSENIFELIAKNEQISAILEKDQEPNTSYINFWFYNARKERGINGLRMKSYLKWKLANTSWLNTEANYRVPPNKCSTAAYITEEFTGLIEKPKIDYEQLQKKGVSKEKAEYLLSVVGVHKTISTFSTHTLYSILLELPIIDPDGKKAKTIYNQLVANYDEKIVDKLDSTDNNYIQFHKSGKVYCTNGIYTLASEAFYVNDKRYGETIIKHFNTIEIDRRRGKDKISKIFGVRPLDKIELTLLGAPIIHSLNTSFEMEMQAFKPFVYVLRKEVDTGSEKNIIKDTNFRLVKELQVNLKKHDGSNSVIDLDKYEYLYLKSRNIVYIKAPDQASVINDLKEDIHFCSSVAEAYTAILDVDAQRQLIRELFSKSHANRDELLRSEIDDENLKRLNDARKKLGVISNPKLDFWKAFVRCFKNKKWNGSGTTDIEIKAKLNKLFPIHFNLVENAFDNINYLDINEDVSSELIVGLFKTFGISITQFNQFHYPSIDVSQLYALEFRKCISDYKEIFKSLLYRRCEVTPFKRAKFLKTIDNYSNTTSPIYNEIDFNVPYDLHDIILEEFDIDIFEKTKLIDFDALYSKNLGRIRNKVQALEIENKLFNQFLQEDITAQSLLFFEIEIEHIIARLNNWMGSDTNQGDNSPYSKKSRKISFGGSTLFYDDLSELKNQVEKIIESFGIDNISHENIIIEKSIKGKGKKQGEAKPANFRMPKLPKEDIGFLGEYLVYKHLLKNSSDPKEVKWVSEYAKTCGHNHEGKDGYGYDFIYTPKGSKYSKYVDVKVVGKEDAFHISPNEVRVGEINKRHYEIFLVRNLDSLNQIKIEKIQGLFDYKGKTFTENDKFSVLNENYLLKFRKEID